MWSVLSRLFGTFERPSPSNITPRESITWAPVPIIAARVEIDLTHLNLPLTKTPRVWIPSVPDTNSMDPVVDMEGNNILIAGQDDGEQQLLLNWLEQQPPGNVVVYRIPNKIYAIHRIVKVKRDVKGVYYIMKGDNNPIADPWSTRSSNIEWLSVGVIY